MKRLIIGILLGTMVMIGCGDDEEPKAGICEMCNENADCEDDLDCYELYDMETCEYIINAGCFCDSVGKYCIDTDDRICNDIYRHKKECEQP